MNGVAIVQLQEKYHALKKADFLVVGEIYPDETSEFWKSPGIHHGRDEADSNHRLPLALRGICRERRFVHQSARWLLWKNTPCQLPEMPGWTRRSWPKFS